MLSAERSLDPSFSSSSSPNQIEIKSDHERNSALERIDSEKLDTIDLVASPPTPNFSIRDYVYKSRSKGIGACWPFKPKFLQLCLKNGVKELLPPFEPPHLIKNRPVSAVSATPQPVPSVTDVSYQGRKLNNSDNRSIHCDTKNFHSAVIRDHKKKRNNKGIKKLVVKLSSNSVPGGGTSRADQELVSNNSAVIIDQMASKICPVCKTFSSSSNTTLNAHIDQCLSVGSSNKQFELDVLKQRIKPRKKKLMVEIYATALEYTLEDLDRRNGTNWALSGAVAADPSEVRAEPISPSPKEPENPRPVEVESRGKEREGAVYVDSNGIKIRILSKFSDAPPTSPFVVSREEKKKGKIKFGKRKCGIIGSKNMKKKKLKLETKKFKQFKVLKTKVQQPPTEGDGSGTGNENKNGRTDLHPDPLSETSKDPVILNSSTSPLGNWVCAKRSDIHKKRKNKNPYKFTQNLAQIVDHSPSTSSQIPKYSISKLSNSTLRLKLPKPSVGNGGNNREAIFENASTNTGFCNNPSAEPQKTPPLPRKFRKQRSMFKFRKKRGEISPPSSWVFHESTEIPVGETIRENKRLKFTQNAGYQEEFAPEMEQIRENTEVQIANSPMEDTQLEIEASASRDHFDEPNILENNASWLQEERADVTNDAHEDDDDNEDHDNDDDDVMDSVDDDDDDVIETPDETSLETPQDDSSITSNGEEEINLERSLANFRDLSESPSTASTMSLSTLNEPVSNQPGSSDLPAQVADRSKGVEEITDKPCVCSCRESSLSKESINKAHTVTKEKQLPPLYIGPRDAGPFSAYHRSFSRPDMMMSGGFESPTQSFSTLSQSPVPPSPSNPILRLMGKNLLVVNHEEITNQPPTPSSHSPSGNFGPPNCGSSQNFAYQNFGPVVTRSQPVPNLYQQRPVSPSPYVVPKEVIIIEDSPKMDNNMTVPVPVPVPVPMQLPGGGTMVGPAANPVMQPRPFYCYPTQNQAGPTGPFFYPRVGTGYITQQQVRPTTGAHEPGPFVPGSFVFRSPTSHVGNPLYYSHTMR